MNRRNDIMKRVDDIKKYIEENALEWFKCWKVGRVNARLASQGEKVQTVMKDGTQETDVRTANAGDWIITNPDGEQYIIGGNTFRSRYQEVRGEAGVYEPKKNIMLAAKTSEDIEFCPPTWGGDVQRLKAGGFLMKNPANEDDIYGIAKDEFEHTYERVDTSLNEVDLTKKQGTIGNVFAAHRDELLSVKSSAEAYSLVKKLFDDNGISTPKSRQILMKLQHGMGYVQTVTYLNNILMKSQGLGILDSEKSEMSQVEESESASGSVGSVSTYYCRDLVYEDAPDDSDLKVAELFVSGNSFLRDKLPISVTDDDYESMKKQNAKDADTYRFIAYFVDSAYDSKWYDAVDNIGDEADFNDYIDKGSVLWHGMEDDFPQDFADTFKTYADWKKHLESQSIKKLKDILTSSGKLPYESLADEVKVNRDGIAYVIVGWRA